MEIAFGSLMEVEAQIDIAVDLGYVNKDELDRVRSWWLANQR